MSSTNILPDQVQEVLGNLADTAFGVSKDVTSTGPKDLVLFEAFSQVESCPNWKAESFWAAASEQAKLQGVNLDISTQLLSISTARQDKQDMTVATATMKLDGEKMDVEMGGNTAAPALPTARRVMDVDEDYSEFDIE
ncbi:hypothetical protein M7I_4269 [Glarea lozoyensis 74030]|uniref:Uncharacterized protein n=1 Tax=Glarea lozoyensis (strain ATCC 74030 / MF5533) TaxID=1104152 RepID=H0ENQ6_GLAL7|nr:hypothetical protein M7I_4269 [Glarea lozoyensis 74030]